MNIIDIINKKVASQALSYDEIKYTIDGYLDGTINDYQISSLLMAIFFNGMSIEETSYLTEIMINNTEGNLVDFISVGNDDDKLNKVVNILLSTFDVVKVNKEVNIDSELVSRKLLKLSRASGTIASVPILAASIISEKVSCGVNKLVVDIKVGVNSFINDVDKAEELADLMIEIGKKYNCEIVCFITEDTMLGNTVGKSLDIIEISNTLKGNGPTYLTKLATMLSSYLISIHRNISLEDSTKLVIDKINNGSAYNKFAEMYKKDVNNIIVSNKVFSIKSNISGFVKKIDTLKVKEIVDKIDADDDPTVGIVVTKNLGDYVIENEELAKVYLNEVDLGINELLECFEIADIVGELPPLIKKIIK